MSSTAAVAVVAIGLVFLTFTGQCSGALEVGFYQGKCGRFVDVEGIVAGVVRTKFFRDRTIAAALIRMQFHDCFVNSGGGRYNVQTGRRDGLISLAANVDLPAPSISVPDSVAAFAGKGLNMTDMVHLLGGHTVGVAHCFLFQDRLYNFQNTGKPDPDMNVALLEGLRRICPQNSAGTNTANLDQNPQSSFIVDNSFYKEIVARRGILQIDQELALDPITQATVTTLANNGTNSFATKFGQAMVKLGAVEVLTGSQGEIRRSCRAVNKPGFLTFN
ncbi:peroxidase 60 [Prunus yedoensis var. nudiflora]|uniref:peroxidase n=1 Tax=Prunus yedoensis var. nudiflora TaxID=2094558 RepID=A0A314ZCN8_PRUYE|nr:peroxidase 60 [Prunus yedoensis var. nudiflora]